MTVQITCGQVYKAGLKAAWEVESISAILLRLAPEAADGSLLDEFAVRCFALRLRTLSSALMTIFDEVADQGSIARAGASALEAVLEVYGQLPEGVEGGDE